MYWYIITSNSYTEAYRRLVKFRLQNHGVREAVGGDDLGIGRLQFEFLKDHGLTEQTKLLDIGCGTLRGGQYFISYLDSRNYVGMDISREALKNGIELVGEDTIEKKAPEFYVNDDLRFQEISGDFDRVLAQSVLTHLPEEQIRELFEHVGSVMAEDAIFYATFFNETTSHGPQSFGYSSFWLSKVAKEYGLHLRVLPDGEYPHPRNQQMAEITLE